MLLTTTECKNLLNISLATTTNDTLIDLYKSYVLDDLVEIVNHRFHDAYHWIRDDGFTITSSNKTITIATDSTVNFNEEFQVGDTIDIIQSYNNDGFYTISSITGSHVMAVSESLIAENSTTYQITTYIYRCLFEGNIKRIAAKMIWWNIQNSTTVQGDIASESLGSYSVSYRDNGVSGYGLYPNSLLAGLSKKANSW